MTTAMGSITVSSSAAEDQRLPRSLGVYTITADEAIGSKARKLLEDYSGIPSDQVNDHVVAIREKAFAIHHYPCIGGFRFLDLSMSSMPIYPTVISRLQAGDKLLDLGCCFGQEIRMLVADGAPAENLHASDLRQSFWDLGFDLFLDKGRLATTFLAADIFDEHSPLEQLKGQMNMVYTGSFFHLFDLPEQRIVARRVVELLKPAAGSMILGRHMGNVKAQDSAASGGQGGRVRHSVESWKEFWNDVGEETGTKWEADVEAEEARAVWWPSNSGLPEMDRHEAGSRRLRFVVKRL